MTYIALNYISSFFILDFFFFFTLNGTQDLIILRQGQNAVHHCYRHSWSSVPNHFHYYIGLQAGMLDNTHGNGKAIHGMTGCVNKRKTQTKPEGQMNKIPNTSSSQLQNNSEN